MLFSVPDQKSVKYNAIVYYTEEQCIIAKKEYMKEYENKEQEYLDRTKTEAFCIPFDSFPLNSMQNTNA